MVLTDFRLKTLEAQQKGACICCSYTGGARDLAGGISSALFITIALVFLLLEGDTWIIKLLQRNTYKICMWISNFNFKNCLAIREARKLEGCKQTN